eukprot:NODE_921_length_3051_cov_0.675813.p4 type:complete len:140 gc:universal NODE_921_length_3051_cov_0.675813:2142-2561(+)
MLISRIFRNTLRMKTEDEWRAVLSPEQFKVLRQSHTEPPNSSKYNKMKESGTYLCAGCNTPLYKSTTKFDSGCGWPAYYEGLPGAIKRTEDKSMGMSRIEIKCAKCDGHLGHVFKGEGYKTPTDERHCVNGISLTFKKE